MLLNQKFVAAIPLAGTTVRVDRDRKEIGMAVIWGREMYRSAYAPADRSEGCYRIVRAYDERWYVATARCERIAGPYTRAASARRKAMMLVARYSAASSGVHPQLRKMAHAEAAAIRQAAARPAWH